MTKKSETLEEGLNRSADKRGLTGKEKHRYIGGALHNMGKGRTRSGKREPVSRSHTAASRASTTHKPVLVTPARKKAYSAPTLTKREHLSLGVREKKNSGKHYPVYEIFDKKTKSAYKGGGEYRKKSAATAEAKHEMDAHNDIHGRHVRGTLT